MSRHVDFDNDTDKPQEFQVAVVGGGIVGLAITCGLLRRGIKVKVYEQARAIGAIGAGIAFTACAQRCMERLDPAIAKAFWSAGAVPLSSAAGSDDPNDYLRWVDGFNSHPGRDPRWQEQLYELSAGVKGFVAVRRDEFAAQMVKLLPSGVVELQKRLEDIVDEVSDQEGRTGRKVLVFGDGSRATVDAVIGCDGVKSKVREVMFGKDNPASYPTYTHIAAYRAVIPMDTAIKILGERRAKTFNNHLGPGGNLLHYAVSNQTLVSITVFVSDPSEWPDHRQLTRNDGSKAHLLRVFARFNPTVVDLIRQLPDETLPRWGIFDLAEYPLSAFNSGRVVLAGDAAHASAPQHGAGAGIGMEDALCLVTLLERVRQARGPRGRQQQHAALEAAFASYDAVRRTRCQWFVNSSRRITDLHQQREWGDPARLLKAKSCFEEIKDRSHKIWHFDYEGMVEEAGVSYEKLLSGQGTSRLATSRVKARL
ncbi:hypothetical protein MCOR29_004510 [Pyricularia oryzae]|nr:hypothetical protein MCOR29_004510 [Pyricularia oryzae]KAI6401499.1 hypothetical protein MCOR20_008053 [Pyricularia oryzae]KAI6643886.1 hypothetical protein MCOR14_001695 [Pyricularia oryzae]